MGAATRDCLVQFSSVVECAAGQWRGAGVCQCVWGGGGVGRGTRVGRGPSEKRRPRVFLGGSSWTLSRPPSPAEAPQLLPLLCTRRSCYVFPLRGERDTAREIFIENVLFSFLLFNTTQ